MTCSLASYHGTSRPSAFSRSLLDLKILQHFFASSAWMLVTHPPWTLIASLPTHLSGSLVLGGGSQSLCLTDHTWRVWNCYGPGHHHCSCWAVSSLLPWKADPRHLGPCLYMVMDGFSPSALTGFCTGSVTLLPVLSKYPQEDRNQGSEISLFVLTPHD